MNINLGVNSIKINIYDKIHFATLETKNILEIEINSINLKNSKLSGIYSIRFINTILK